MVILTVFIVLNCEHSISFHLFADFKILLFLIFAICREELPQVRGQGQKPGGPHVRKAVAKRSYPTSEVGGGEAAKRRYPASEVRGSNERSYPVSEVRGSGLEELPHAPTPEAGGGGWEDQAHTIAAWAQEGLEELSHVEGQERWQ